MLLEKANINNFRCFRNYEVSFARSTTIFIGKNGTGKTNLINALKKGLSFIFSRKAVGISNNLVLGENLHISKFDQFDAYFNHEDRDFLYPIGITIDSVFGENKLLWTMKKQRPNGSILETGYRNALKNYFEYANIKGNLIPLIISFSDSYPHIKSNISKNANRIINNEILPRSLAYYQWDADTNCSEIWQRRFNFSYDKMMDDAFNESLFTENKDKPTLPDIIKSSTFYPEYKFILERLIRFSEPLEPEFPIINDEFAIKDISTIRSNGLKNIIYVKMKDGQNILFNHLPQGYKRLYSMVLDIAYRSYILNQNREPEGVVFIDEIELHLHPSLQQEVLNRFRKTFPKIQFIVSTHSPLVISNIKKNDEYGPNKIIKLSRVSDQYANSEIENLYGVDYITSLMEGMDSTYRLSTIDKLINLYVSLKYRDKEDEAGKIYDKLNELFKGNINQFIKKEIEKKIEQNQK